VKREYTPVPYQTTIASVNASTNTRVDIRSKKNTVEHVDTINNMEPSAKKRNADPHYKAGDNTGRNVNTNTNVKIEVSNIERVVKDDTNDYDGKKSALLDDTSTSSSTNSLRTPKIQSNVVIPVESINPTDEKQIRTGNNKAVADTTTPRMAVTSKGIKDEDKDIINNNNNNKNNNKTHRKLIGESGNPDDTETAVVIPKEKKPRVKAEKVKEVYSKIIQELAKNYSFGMKEVPLDTIASAVGYKNPRSDAVADSLKELIMDGIVHKPRKGVCMFTPIGIERYAPKIKECDSPEAAMEQFWKQFLMKLSSNSKTSGKKVAEAAKVVWDELKDGQFHSKHALVAMTTYGMVRSTGYGEMISALGQLRFTNSGPNETIAFTDKVFPFGRPAVSTADSKVKAEK
jgi:hypothetical protein